MVPCRNEIGTCCNNHRGSWYHNCVHLQCDFRDSFGQDWTTEGSICIFVVHLCIYALLRVPCRSLLRFLPSFSYRFYQISHSEPQWSGFSNPPQFLEKESRDESVTLLLNKVLVAWIECLPFTFLSMDICPLSALCSRSSPMVLCRGWAPKLGRRLTQRSWWPGPIYSHNGLLHKHKKEWTTDT